MITEVKTLKTNLLQMAPRPFGEKFGEWVIFELDNTLESRNDGSHDAIYEKKRVEIKLSRAKFKFNKKLNFLSSLISTHTSSFVRSDTLDNFDCNIQQVKPNCFDILIYGVFFEDIIYIFKTTTAVLLNDKKIGYNDKQHRGNVGEGQFHIKRTNLQYHIDNFLYKKLEYMDLIKMIQSNND